MPFTKRRLLRAPLLVLVSLLLFVCVSSFGGRNKASRVAVSTQARNPKHPTGTLHKGAGKQALIEPGKGVGQLKLGDTREHTLQLFPAKRNIDEEISTDNCGDEYIWLDSETERPGNLSVRFQDSVVFQIESGTPRFRTTEGIKAYDSPDVVRQHYRDLRAYALLGNSPMAFGGGSLIYWIDWAKGIAFFFASTRRDHQRYLYSIIVFKPGGKFCPERESTDSPDWRELAPYSLEAGQMTASAPSTE